MNETWVAPRVRRGHDFPVRVELMRETLASTTLEGRSSLAIRHRSRCLSPEGCERSLIAERPPQRGTRSAAASRGRLLRVPFAATTRPMLFLWAESDTFLTLASGQRLATQIGRRIDHVPAVRASPSRKHQGQAISESIVDWLGGGD